MGLLLACGKIWTASCTITQAEGGARTHSCSVLPWGTLFAGPGQCHLQSAAECALHPFSHPCFPWENTSLEPRCQICSVLGWCCCIVARANYILRVVHPELTAGFAAHHDASLRRCLSQLLGVDPSVVYWDLASLLLSLGGLGLRATLMSRPAYWSIWANCLGMVQQRHPTVSASIVEALNH